MSQDIQDLVAVSGDLLAFGEPTHREPAFALVRNELLARLVGHGFRSVALEIDRVAALVVDDHVREGTGSLDEVMREGFSHGWGAGAQPALWSRGCAGTTRAGRRTSGWPSTASTRRPRTPAPPAPAPTSNTPATTWGSTSTSRPSPATTSGGAVRRRSSTRPRRSAPPRGRAAAGGRRRHARHPPRTRAGTDRGDLARPVAAGPDAPHRRSRPPALPPAGGAARRAERADRPAPRHPRRAHGPEPPGRPGGRGAARRDAGLRPQHPPAAGREHPPGGDADVEWFGAGAIVANLSGERYAFAAGSVGRSEASASASPDRTPSRASSRAVPPAGGCWPPPRSPTPAPGPTPTPGRVLPARPGDARRGRRGPAHPRRRGDHRALTARAPAGAGTAPGGADAARPVRPPRARRPASPSSRPAARASMGGGTPTGRD